MGIWEDFKSIFTDDYKAGVRSTSKSPVVFVDIADLDEPELSQKLEGAKLDLKNPKHIEILKDHVAEKIHTILDKQYPGLADGLTRDELFDIGTRVKPDGYPAAALVEIKGQRMCVVTEPASGVMDKEKWFSIISKSGMPEGRHREVPGWQDHWERGIGKHEGQHCNQNTLFLGKAEADFTSLGVLKRELDSDRALIKYFRENGLDDMAQYWTDFRILSAANDSEHSTGVLLSQPESTPVTQAHLDAANTFRDTMFVELQHATGKDWSQLYKEQRENPKQFFDRVDTLLKEGKLGVSRFANPVEQEEIIRKELGMSEEDFEAFKETDEGYAKYNELYLSMNKNGGFLVPQDNPHVKEYIKAYSEAYRRQIIDKPNPEPLPHEKRNGADASDVIESQGIVDVASEVNNRKPSASNSTSTLSASSALAANNTLGGRYEYLDIDQIGDGNPIVVLDEGDRSQMSIGGVSASAFFASYADPYFAQQRLAQEDNTPDLVAVADLSDDINYSAPNTQPASFTI